MSNMIAVNTYGQLSVLASTFATKALAETSAGTRIPISKDTALDLVRDGAEFTLDAPDPNATRKLRGVDGPIPEDRQTIVVHVA